MQVELQQWLMSPIAQLQPGDLALVPKQTLHLSPGGAGVQMLRKEYESGLHLLMWISTLVLLIACANVANLMLVRATNRKVQTSIRAALGASPSRQIRQVLTESAVLAMLGGTAGVAIAFAGTRLILWLAFQQNYVAIKASPSVPVLAFAFLVALLTGISFGVAPAWVTAKAAPADALRGAGRHWARRRVDAEVSGGGSGGAVVGAAIGRGHADADPAQYARSKIRLRDRRPIHRAHRSADGRIQARPLDAFYRRLHDSLSAIPGIVRVSFSMYSPMDGDNWGETVFIEGQAPPEPGSNQNNALWLRVSDGYFDAIGTKIIQGRVINDQDSSVTQHVAVVNQTFAKRFFRDGNPIGKHFGYFGPKHAGEFEIVGVTEDTQYGKPTRKMFPMFFLPATQRVVYDDPQFLSFEDRNHYLSAIELKTAGELPGLESQVRRTLAGVNPDLAVVDFVTFANQVEVNFSQQAMIAKLTSLFGFLALVLASVGLYGVTAYSVERRTNEIGIRMALGAGRSSVLRLVLGGAMVEMAIALAIGVPTAIAAGRAMTAQLFGVKPYDLHILMIATAALALAAFLAALVPAWRAATLDPARALHTE